MLGGFLAIFSVEALLYYRSTGDPLLSYHIQSGASQYKYLHESVSSVRWGWLQVRYTNGAPLDLVRSVLLLDGGPTNQFGFFFFLFFASALFSLIRRRNLLLLTLAIGLFLYLEFGPLRLSVDWPHRDVQYMMLFKQQRFLLMLTAPFVVMAAYFLCAIGRTSQIAAALLMLVLFATSVAAIARTRDHYRAGLYDLRAVADDVRSNPDRVFLGGSLGGPAPEDLHAVSGSESSRPRFGDHPRPRPTRVRHARGKPRRGTARRVRGVDLASLRAQRPRNR